MHKKQFTSSIDECDGYYYVKFKNKILELIDYYKDEEIHADNIQYERVCSSKTSVLHELLTETNNAWLIE